MGNFLQLHHALWSVTFSIARSFNDWKFRSAADAEEGIILREGEGGGGGGTLFLLQIYRSLFAETST